MMMAVDKVVVAKHAMKKATKKAKFLESACASRALLFSFPKREMKRLDVWVVPLFQLLLCSFVSSNWRPIRLTTLSSLLSPFLWSSSCAHTQRYVGRNESNPASRASISKKQQSSKSKQKKRKSIQFGLADFAKDLNASLLETTASMNEEYEVEEDVEDAVERVRRE